MCALQTSSDTSSAHFASDSPALFLQRLDQEVDNLGTRLDQIGQQCEPLLNHASRAPSQADLRAELDRCLQIRPHLSDLSTSSLDRCLYNTT